MTIRLKPPASKKSPPTASVPDPTPFISQAPDAQKPEDQKPEAGKRGGGASKKVEFFLSLDRLARLDALADRTGETRASLVRRIVIEALNEAE